MTVGFSFEAEGTDAVQDGIATETEKPFAYAEEFVSLCEKLRALGAVEVRAGDYRVRFAGVP